MQSHLYHCSKTTSGLCPFQSINEVTWILWNFVLVQGMSIRSDTYLTFLTLTRNVKFFSFNFICKGKTVLDMSLIFSCTELAAIFQIPIIIENPVLPILLRMWWACKTNLSLVTTICKYQYHWFTNGNYLNEPKLYRII